MKNLQPVSSEEKSTEFTDLRSEGSSSLDENDHRENDPPIPVLREIPTVKYLFNVFNLEKKNYNQNEILNGFSEIRDFLVKEKTPMALSSHGYAPHIALMVDVALIDKNPAYQRTLKTKNVVAVFSFSEGKTYAEESLCIAVPNQGGEKENYKELFRTFFNQNGTIGTPEQTKLYLEIEEQDKLPLEEQNSWIWVLTRLRAGMSAKISEMSVHSPFAMKNEINNPPGYWEIRLSILQD